MTWSWSKRDFNPRMRLRRADGQVYMSRWGFQWRPWFGVYVHRLTAPDPGVDLHDHPWNFVSVILKGGYVEERAETSWASHAAYNHERFGTEPRGEERTWRRFTAHRLPLTECHRIVRLRRPVCWSLVIHGRWVRPEWGFYTPDGYIESHLYDTTVRAGRRDLWNEV